jgi:hypothetical protein
MCYDDELWLRLAAVSELDGVEECLTRVRRHGAHGGSDVIAWRDRRRVVERVLRAETDPRRAAHWREQRALMSAGLARSHTRGGVSLDALRTLALSAPHGWRYPKWWSAALGTTARALAPQRLRAAVRALRS